jgi:N-acetylmuramoyl-L-alanine amidase
MRASVWAIALACVLPFFAAAQASDVRLTVVYPGEGDKLPFVRESFVFGSAAPGSHVSVNGIPALVAPGGGWIAYVPFEPGDFRLHVVAQSGDRQAAVDRIIRVTPPLQTLPPVPARIDAAMAAAPSEDMTLQAGDGVRLFVKASTGARVFASANGTSPVPLTETSAPELIPTEQQRVLGDMTASGETVSGLYQGELRIPQSAAGTLRITYAVEASDGSSATETAQGVITVEPQGWYRVGSVVLADHRKDIDARPYGVVESAPDGGWLMFPPANTRLEITGSEGPYYRVKLGANQEAWIRKESLRLAAAGTPALHAVVGGIIIRDGARWGTVLIHVSQRVPFSIDESTAGPSLQVHFYNAAASTDLIRYGSDRSNIREVRWEQLPGDEVTVTVFLRQRALWGYHAAWEGSDLALAVKKPPAFKRPPAEALSGLLVVIDPGHSPDSGAIGPLGTWERDVNLGIAKRLAAHLEALGARAVLTRTANVPVGLYDRPQLAARLGADVLISVHNNALPDGVNPFTHHGFSVYYYQPQSLELARAIHAAYLRDTQLADYGLYYDNLALTRATEEPAVLTESAFVMWPPEESELRDPSFQDRLGMTMADGLERWAESMRLAGAYKRARNHHQSPEQ